MAGIDVPDHVGGAVVDTDRESGHESSQKAHQHETFNAPGQDRIYHLRQDHVRIADINCRRGERQHGDPHYKGPSREAQQVQPEALLAGIPGAFGREHELHSLPHAGSAEKGQQSLETPHHHPGPEYLPGSLRVAGHGLVRHIVDPGSGPPRIPACRSVRGNEFRPHSDKSGDRDIDRGQKEDESLDQVSVGHAEKTAEHGVKRGKSDYQDTENLGVHLRVRVNRGHEPGDELAHTHISVCHVPDQRAHGNHRDCHAGQLPCCAAAEPRAHPLCCSDHIGASDPAPEVAGQGHQADHPDIVPERAHPHEIENRHVDHGACNVDRAHGGAHCQNPPGYLVPAQEIASHTDRGFFQVEQPDHQHGGEIADNDQIIYNRHAHFDSGSLALSNFAGE